MDSGLKRALARRERGNSERAERRLLIHLIVLTNQTAKNSTPPRAPSLPIRAALSFLSFSNLAAAFPSLSSLSLLQIIVTPQARLTGKVGVSVQEQGKANGVESERESERDDRQGEVDRGGLGKSGVSSP